MSLVSRPRSASQSTRVSNRSARSTQERDTSTQQQQQQHQQPPPPPQTLTPASDGPFQACAATGTYFLYAQANVILCLHHDTLTIERRFERHRDSVLWINADNVSEKGSGRLIVSYDASQTTIVWDVLTGDEVARFASFEEIRIAAWMRSGNIAFGNAQGNVILFEPATVEHVSARTIFDPITALAPAADCRTFAIGYMNGTILIAVLQPSFTIVHTLTTSRAPSPMNGLAWHGSSSKQKSDMLAAQTADGDLRVWSIPKNSPGEPPSIIRVLQRPENDRLTGPCWFGWSKMGRIVQYSNSLTFVWDVRTKKVTYESVPTVDGIIGIANHGATATLFSLGRNHTVQQYDLNPNNRAPQLVTNVQHVPSKLPPSPPISDGERSRDAHHSEAESMNSRNFFSQDESSADEGAVAASPRRRSPEESLEDEARDRLGALSPVSSRSSLSSRSASGYYRSSRRSGSSKNQIGSSGSSYGTGTTFSSGSSAYYQQRQGRDSISIRTTSSSNSRGGSRLRQEVLNSPEDASMVRELFPYTKARLSEVPFMPPIYNQHRRTPDDLRQQMLQVVFGWSEDAELLIRDELSRHQPGSAGAVMLSKWLGDTGVDIAASMISADMTSSDWMLLALSSMGTDSQKKVGEVFVQRLMAKGDIHSSVAILLGLREHEDAIEAYVSRKYFMESVLLACLIFPNDWGRISHLTRKWGEHVVSVEPKQPELAVRCFSCTSVESSEPWFSPRAKDAVYAAQQAILGPSPIDRILHDPPLSPPVVEGLSQRKNPAMAGLKVITNFAAPTHLDPLTVIEGKTPLTYVPGGVTPIEPSSAFMSPGGYRSRRDPTSALTATPGGFERRRLPSRGAYGRDGMTPVREGMTPEPATAVKESRFRGDSIDASRPFSPTASSTVSGVSGRSRRSEQARGRGLPPPSTDVMAKLQGKNSARNGSRDRKPEGLTLHMDDIVIDQPIVSSNTNTTYTSMAGSAITASSIQTRSSRRTAQSVDMDIQHSKARGINDFIRGLDQADDYPRERVRGESRPGRDRTTTGRRAPSESSVRFAQQGKRSPSSPVSMSPDDPALSSMNIDSERFYRSNAPSEASTAMPGFPSRTASRADSRTGRRAESVEPSLRARSRSRVARPVQTSGDQQRGRSKSRAESSRRREVSDERPELPSVTFEDDHAASRPRERSGSRKHRDRAASSSGTRERSRSARRPEEYIERSSSRQSDRPPMPRLNTNVSGPPNLAKKTLAAQELEARRLSLARRPSAPAIIHPDELIAIPRTADPQNPSPTGIFSIPSERQLMRSMSVDPDMYFRGMNQMTGISTSSVPMGLPATPRAMRHPKYMGSSDEAPAVPGIPEAFAVDPIMSPSDMPAAPDGAPLLLLPATTFVPTGPMRSASAPAEKMMRNYNSLTRPAPRVDAQQFNHSRANSHDDIMSPAINSIAEALQEAEEEVVIVDATPNIGLGQQPAVLAQLQHLAGPPPPPPPPLFHNAGPVSSAAAVVVVEQPPVLSAQNLAAVETNAPEPSFAASHRRGRGSVSESVTSVGSRLRGVTGRLRDRSASRPRIAGQQISQPVPASMPYESVPAHKTSAPTGNNVSPLANSGASMPAYETAYATAITAAPAAATEQLPILPASTFVLPATTFGGYRNPKDIARQLIEQHANEDPGPSLPSTSYRDPIQRSATAQPFGTSSNRPSKEFRANMPPASLQRGAEF